MTAPFTPQRFVGKISLVTGAAGDGIGRATANRLAAEGATVVLTDIHRSRLAKAVDELAATHDERVTGIHLDMGDRSSIDKAVDEALARFGRVDVLVNNAAINALGPLHEISYEDWEQTIAVDLTGPWYLIKRLLPRMYENGFGSIINISSVASFLTGRNEVPYAAAKVGLQLLTRTVALEGGPRGVRCNAIAPGVIESRFVAKYAEKFELFRQTIPLGRFGKPDEVATAIAFLASEDAAYITGETLTMSGGSTMRS